MSEKQRYNVAEIDLNKDGHRLRGWQVWDDDDPDEHKIVQTYSDKETAERVCKTLNGNTHV